MMTRLIDLMCDQHRDQVLSSRMWPVGWRLADCRDCTDDQGEADIFPAVSAVMEMAVHEAGHAVAYLLNDIPVLCIDLGGNDRFAAYTNTVGHDQSAPGALSALWAGPAAVRAWLDRQGLLDAAAEVDVAQSSRSDTATVVEAAANASERLAARDRADRLVLEHLDAILRVAERLVWMGRLTGAEVGAIADLDCGVPA